MFSKIIDRLRSIAHRKKSISQPNTLIFGGISIQLPAEQLLPTFLKEHKLYDKFLPHLAKHLELGDLVVDVGANCGDTLAAMISENPRLKFVCIEPDNDFYAFLERNTERIKQHLPEASITLVKSFISATNATVGLVGSGGTRTRDKSASPKTLHQTRSLENVLTSVHAGSQLRLIKTDVDGYDYDVLNSTGKWLNHDDLMLFFECMYDEEFQREGFIKLIETLPSKGFSDFWLFDNFGNFMLHVSDFRHIEQLIDYIWRQNLGLATRSLYYFDILATKPSDRDLATGIINSYIEGIHRVSERPPSSG